MTGSVEGFPDEQLVVPPAGPPVLLGVELTPIRIGLLIGITGLGAAGFLAFTQLRPLIEEVQALEREVANKTTQLQDIKSQIASLQDVPNQVERARVEREQISALLSTPENADTQLLDLNRLVQGQPNSELRSFSPSPLTPASSANPEVPGIIAPAIQVQTTRVALRGPYTELINLMGDIERLRTLFRVSNISLNPVQDTGELDAAFDLIAYIYNKDVPLGTAPAPEGQAPPEGEQAAPSQ